jgi:hypothetical protein
MERPDQKDGAYNDWQTEQFLTSDVSAHGVIFVFHLIAAGCPGNVRASNSEQRGFYWTKSSSAWRKSAEHEAGRSLVLSASNP